tara:strand:- start:100 stop:570 length:471 start_codon:yes stop_codon:yes gene_type:complete
MSEVTINEIVKDVRKLFFQIQEQVEIIQKQIDETCDDCQERFKNFLKLEKRKCIVYAKFINAFLSRDLKLLKTLNKKYSDISSDFISEYSEIQNSEDLRVSFIDLDSGITKIGDDGFLNICNMEREYYDNQIELIEILEIFFTRIFEDIRNEENQL